ncbi:MAG TPA: acetate/propionate family kinase [Methylomirabilota bacterium]|nr:acetate/propionate family kinase [Methylomirabilota bacterium]
MADTILVVNAGSSSIKFSLFEIGRARDLTLTSKGQLDGIGSHPHLRVRDARGATLADEKLSATEVPDVPAAMTRVGGWLGPHLGGAAPVAVGHRVVHGGPEFASPRRVDASVLTALERLIPLAPLHQPACLHPIRIILERFPRTPQVVCFDTAFHRAHPEVADRYALPDALYREGVRRYGFHGLSYEYIARSLPKAAPDVARGAIVVAHLGSGASMCAIRDGTPVDTTMGFTALDGLPMGTRCGQLDPGVLLYLLGERKMSVREVEHLLYHESGLRGLSGVSNDVRDLLASDTPGARLALDYFVYRIARETGALAGAMGGIDALVFTAGVGENSPDIRARVCTRLEWLGLRLDAAANREGRPRISEPGCRVSAWVIPTDEERMIAEHTLEVVGASSR